MPRSAFIIDTYAALHRAALDYWTYEEQRYLRDSHAAALATRLQRLEHTLQRQTAERQGDALVARVKDVFHNGLGIKWGDDQIRVFNAFLASCLPLIYGEAWPEEKTRVLREWGLEQQLMYSLVNMARRNGKTFVTSGTAAALVLCVPGIKIAIFSTCKR